MKFLHSMIRVKNLDASMKFYKELIGLKPSDTLRLEDCTLYYLKDESTGVEIELTLNDETPQDGYEKGNAFGHFAFEVEDMDAISRKVAELGYEWLYEPFYMEEAGFTIAFITDPDGNEIEFICKK